MYLVTWLSVHPDILVFVLDINDYLEFSREYSLDIYDCTLTVALTHHLEQAACDFYKCKKERAKTPRNISLECSILCLI